MTGLLKILTRIISSVAAMQSTCERSIIRGCYLFFLCFCMNALFAQKQAFFIDSAGRLGIGKNNPVAALDVNGKIKDSAGYVIPGNGTIIMYSGLRADFEKNGIGKVGSKVEGWALCDGQNGRPRAELANLVSLPNNYLTINWGIGYPLRLNQEMDSVINQNNGSFNPISYKALLSKPTIFYIIKL
jgi:hypothetical protein